MSEPAGDRRREGASIARDIKFDDPDMLVHGWNNVRLTLTTHSAGGLTVNHFEMARRIDGVGG
jgi:pterin-4a-carbinolamine dehydratase